MDTHRIPMLFGLPEAEELTALRAGHINSTFLAVCGGKKYILQSLNSSVFRAPEAVMDNISRIEAAFSDIPEISVPHFIVCEGRNYAVSEGSVWRMYRYIAADPETSADAETAGQLFGTFIRVMDGQTLNTVPAIEGFHSFDRYFAALAAKNGTGHDIMAKLDRLRSTIGQIFTGSLKKRIIHGDAKPDNIIIGDTPAIIDLDTVMYGYTAIDYGDLVRSVCRGKEPDMQAVRDITHGFAQGLGGLLTTDEVKSLYYGVLWLTGELAVRYLTDSLSEVKYFRGKSSAECRARGEELLQQLDVFTAYEGELKEIILSEIY